MDAIDFLASGPKSLKAKAGARRISIPKKTAAPQVFRQLGLGINLRAHLVQEDNRAGHTGPGRSYRRSIADRRDLYLIGERGAGTRIRFRWLTMMGGLFFR
jgi:hypothetical protein